jgi:hypothetical protein
LQKLPHNGNSKNNHKPNGRKNGNCVISQNSYSVEFEHKASNA